MVNVTPKAAQSEVCQRSRPMMIFQDGKTQLHRTIETRYDPVYDRDAGCCRILLLSLNENETKVDGLGSEQSVAFGSLGQRQGVERRLQSIGTEVELVHGRRQ